ncbi:MAG: LuxR C-terminal-related transcriptional regulator [Thermomicrobiales bacterium]
MEMRVQPEERDPEQGIAGNAGVFAGEGIPAPTTLLVGRDREIGAIEALLADESVRIVTLVGPGGVGKTRLALAVAGATVAQDAFDVRFVPLSPIVDASLVPQAVMRALGLEAIPGLPVLDILAASIADAPFLLLIDNVEHVVAGAALFVDLLHRCPALRLLVTSRMPLEISGEHIVRVQPLSLPERRAQVSVAEVSQSAAVQLFVDRSRAVFAEFRLTASNAADVAEVCRRLDGLPLAIELAASRSGQFSPRVLAERLSSRVSLLDAGPRDAPSRHRTIRATVEWSVDLLPERERALWRWLGNCEGGFSLETAETFAPLLDVDRDAIAPMLATLADHSLLLQVAGRSGEPRFLMLETTRQVAHDAMTVDPQASSVWDALAERMAEFCTTAEPGLMGPDGVVWFHRVEDELPTIRAVLVRDWERGETARCLRMLGDIGWFWTDATYVAEGRSWLGPMLAESDERIPSEVRAKAASAAAMLANWHNDQAAAQEHGAMALALWQEMGDDARIAEAALNLGNVALDLRQYDEADRWFREAYDHATRADEPWLVAAASNLRGVVAGAQGRTRDAIRWHETALRSWEATGFEGHALAALQSLGWVHLSIGELMESRRAYRRILDLAMGKTDAPEVPLAFIGAALMVRHEGRDALAARLMAAGMRGRDALGLPIRPNIQEQIDAAVAGLRETLGEVAFARSWSEGRAMSFAEATSLTREVLAETGEAMDALSPREREVLELMMEGASDEEIANVLYISRRTASKHVASILEKLGASNRTAAVSIAIRRGVV